MHIQEGQQIEKLLLGEVKNPVKDEDLIDQGVEIISAKSQVKKTRQQIDDFTKHIRRLPNNDPNRRKIFNIAMQPIRDRIYANTPLAFGQVRRSQSDNSESLAPDKKFPAKLLEDIEIALDDVMFSKDGEQIYEAHFFTASGSEIDRAVNVDFWVEMRDVKTGKVVWRSSVDLKTNPNDEEPKRLADYIYYFDSTKYLDEKRKDKINPDAFDDISYMEFLNAVTERFKIELEKDIESKKWRGVQSTGRYQGESPQDML